MTFEPRTLEVLEEVSRLTRQPAWALLRQQCLNKLERYEGSISRIIFKSRSEVDTHEIEYARGFRQGVYYVLDALPNEIQKQWAKALADLENEKEVD